MSKLIDATGNPNTACAAAPDPVVSPVAAAIVTVGADVYVPPSETWTSCNGNPTTAVRTAPDPDPVSVTAILVVEA